MLFSGRRLWSKLAGVVLGGFCAVHGAAAVQAQDVPRTFFNKNRFHLPLEMSDSIRSQIREVQLYTKDSPASPWQFLDKGSPRQSGFNIEPDKEGEYLFGMVMVDQSGKSIPANTRDLIPCLAVVVDWKAPQLEVYMVTGPGEGPTVQVEARDAHLDQARTQLHFQTRDQQWRVLEPMPQFPNRFAIPGQAALTGKIRVSACDFAGNVARRELSLDALLPAAPAADRVIPIGARSTPERTEPDAPKGTNPGPVFPQNPLPIAIPMSPGVPPVAVPQVGTPPQVAFPGHGTPQANPGPQINIPPLPVKEPARTPSPLAPEQPQAALGQVLTSYSGKRDSAPVARRLINQSQLVLEYQLDQVGASGVGKVEVWLTRDQGQSWYKLGEDPDCKSPVAIELPGEGLYGVTLVVSNGRGFGATPPAPGDTPDTWVEVDATRPTAEITGIRPGTGEDSGSITITWTTQDRNLGSDCVDLFYSANREGPWAPIAKGLKSAGRYRWVPPTNIGHTYIRLQVRDHAGNTALAESREPFLLDDQSRPRGRLVSVSPFQGAMQSLPQIPPPPFQLDPMSN